MKLYWDYFNYGEDESYKMLCLKGKNNDWALLKFKISAKEFNEWQKQQ